MVKVMKSRYEDLIWVHDTNGKEYACFEDDLRENDHALNYLSNEDISKCFEIDQIAGAKRRHEIIHPHN